MAMTGMVVIEARAIARDRARRAASPSAAFPVTGPRLNGYAWEAGHRPLRYVPQFGVSQLK
jgi:hypothetical protein